MFYAVHERGAPCVELLIAHGAEVNARNKFGQTPLHMAVFYARGDFACIKLLLARGASVQLTDADGKTAGDTFTFFGSESCEEVRALLRRTPA